MIKRGLRARAHELFHANDNQRDAEIIVKMGNEAIRHREDLLGSSDL
jgi:hypothetical protein